MKDKIFARERDCFEFLKKIPSDMKLVLIGGYAVSAFDFPRLSVDLDIAIPVKELASFRRLLKHQGFKLSEKRTGFDSTYRGRYEKWVKKLRLSISVDLLINSVQARQTNHSYSFEYLFKNSEVRQIRGWHPDSKAVVRVPDREMLIALKVNSMRMADKRDIILLCYKKPDVEIIAAHLKDCPKKIISDQLEGLLEVLTSTKHKDSIKGAFSISNKVLETAAVNCRNTIKEILVLLPS